MISFLGWILIILAIIFVLALLLINARRGSEMDAPKAEMHAPVETPDRAVMPERVAVFPEAAAAAVDDLTKIEGIGPKIGQVLQENGIHNFAQLAATEVSALQAILDLANLRLANPESWPEQARLAAAGRWDEFNLLTSQLRGGKRV